MAANGRRRVGVLSVGMMPFARVREESTPEMVYRVSRDGRIKEEESTGLGLSFVREVVEQHGGQVFLESTVGHGSKVGFTLPRL